VVIWLSYLDRFNIELKRSFLPLAVMRILFKHKEGIHGYAVAQYLIGDSDKNLLKSIGNIYTVLRRFQKANLVESLIESNESDSKIVYTITQEGIVTFKEMMVLVTHFQSIINSI